MRTVENLNESISKLKIKSNKISDEIDKLLVLKAELKLKLKDGDKISLDGKCWQVNGINSINLIDGDIIYLNKAFKNGTVHPYAQERMSVDELCAKNYHKIE